MNAPVTMRPVKTVLASTASKLLLGSTPCDQCPFTGQAAKKGIIRRGALADIRAKLIRNDTHFVCHKSLASADPTKRDRNSEVVCRGFYDAMPGVGQYLRIAERLNCVVVVPTPDSMDWSKSRKKAGRTIEVYNAKVLRELKVRDGNNRLANVWRAPPPGWKVDLFTDELGISEWSAIHPDGHRTSGDFEIQWQAIKRAWWLEVHHWLGMEQRWGMK